jgi:AmmeMemoRadiSam system protein B
MSIFSNRNQNGIRRPVVAGTFYPGSASKLRSEIERFLSNSEKVPVDGKIVALIVPHAGYVYSGQIAAHAYKQIEGMHFDTVVMIGVSHRMPFRGAAIYKSGAYETPLGTVKVDDELASELMNQTDILEFYPDADAIEHSLEVQVPFLQVVLSDFKIVPILMRDWSGMISYAISDALAKVMKDKNVLIVASTDMSHYHPYKEAVSMDDVALTSIKRMDIEQLDDDLASGEAELCGAGGVIVTLMTAKKLGIEGIEILKYANSGDVTGDKSDGVVGYFSAVIYQKDRLCN